MNGPPPRSARPPPRRPRSSQLRLASGTYSRLSSATARDAPLEVAPRTDTRGEPASARGSANKSHATSLRRGTNRSPGVTPRGRTSPPGGASRRSPPRCPRGTRGWPPFWRSPTRGVKGRNSRLRSCESGAIRPRRTTWTPRRASPLVYSRGTSRRRRPTPRPSLPGTGKRTLACTSGSVIPRRRRWRVRWKGTSAPSRTTPRHSPRLPRIRSSTRTRLGSRIFALTS